MRRSSFQKENASESIDVSISREVASKYDNIKKVADNLEDVNTLAPSIVNINTVATDITNVNTVSTNLVDVNTVAGLNIEITSLYNDKATLDSLYADKVILDSVYADKLVIDALYADKTAIESLYTDKATLDSIFADKIILDSIYADKPTLDSLYADKLKLDSLYTDKTTLDRIYTSIDNIDTVVGAITNIDTTATSIGSVNTVAGSIVNVNLTGDSIVDVNTTAASIGNVTTVATDIISVNTVAGIHTELTSIYNDKSTLDSIFADKIVLDAVYGDKTAIESIYADKNTLDTLYAIKNELDSLFTDKVTLDSIYGAKVTLDRIFTSISNLDRIYTSISNIDTAAADISNIDAVATSISNVDIVAANNSDITVVSSDLVKGIGTNQPTDSAILNALTNAGDASTSASAANASKVEAYDWAQYPENLLVPEGDGSTEYSAYHWAKKAQATATGALIYQGSWDASGGIYPGSPALGDYYKVSVAGTVNSVDFAIGDSIIYNTTDWDKIDNTEQVTSVASKVGAVVLVKADVGLDQVDNTADINKNVLSSTKLTTSRIIGGVSFDGTTNVDLPGVNISGNQDTTGNAGSASVLATARDITLTGDVSGTTSFDGSGTVSIPVVISDNSHNHVSANISDATSANTASMIVERDVNGDFSAGTITAALVGNASTATVLETARTVGIAGSQTGSASFDGSGDITITVAADTASLLTDIKTVDGIGSGLDADLLDGLESTAFNQTHGVTSSTATTTADIIDTLDVSDGVVQTVGIRTLTLNDLGYTGETNATADQTAAEILTALKTVDGGTSGLDSELLNGNNSAYYENLAVDSAVALSIALG